MLFPAFLKTSLAQRCLYTCLPWVFVPLEDSSISFAQHLSMAFNKLVTLNQQKVLVQNVLDAH